MGNCPGPCAQGGPTFAEGVIENQKRGGERKKIKKKKKGQRGNKGKKNEIEKKKEGKIKENKQRNC